MAIKWDFSKGGGAAGPMGWRGELQSYFANKRRHHDEYREQNRPCTTGPRPRTCQFPVGEPTKDDSFKCSRPVQPDSSYCPEHHARCWVKPIPTKR